MTTKADFEAVLRGHPRSDDVIFWYCQAWHAGDDDLYRIMCKMDYYTPLPWSDNPILGTPTGLIKNPNYDPELVQLLDFLRVRIGHVYQPPLERVKLADVREGQVLTNIGTLDILDKWPCRVFQRNFVLGVQRLRSGFNALHADSEGYVIGFMR